MGKKLSDDVLKFIVEIDGKPAQQGLNLVEQETRKLEKSNKSLATEMAKLEANGKKGTAEWKAYEAQIKTNNTSISELKKKQGELRQEVGISNLTVKQLRQEYRRLKQAQDGADPNSKEWKQYDTQLKAIKGRLNELNGAQRKTNGLFGSLKTLMPALGLAAGIALFSRLKDKIFETRAEFEKYEAVLTTTFGSQEKARKEMDMLVDFASKTPFQLNELTNSFVKLTNYGMQPSRKEMESMGDTAASVGKSFDQFAEAIADAATGENERLKEFGIRAAKHGDKIAYTFKGITTEVDNNTESIKKYLFSLGDMEGVAGSMAAISKTMGGQASNLADSFDQLWNNLGKGVAGGVITGSIQGMNSLLGVVNRFLEKPLKSDLWKYILIVTSAVVSYYTAIKIAASWTKIVSAYETVYIAVLYAKDVAISVLTGKVKLATIAQKAWNLAQKANPIGILIAVLVAAGTALALYSRKLSAAEIAQKELNDVTLASKKAIIGEKVEMENLLRIARDEKISKADRILAIKKLNELSPEYLGSLTLEKINTQEAITATENYITALEKKAKAQAANARLEEIEGELIDLKLSGKGAELSLLQKTKIAALSGGNAAVAASKAALYAVENLIQKENDLNEKKKALLEVIKETNKETAGTNTEGNTKVVTSIKTLQDELAKLNTARSEIDITDKKALETNAKEIADLEKKIKLYEDFGKIIKENAASKALTIKELEAQNISDLDEEEETAANYDPNNDPVIQMYQKQDAAEKAIRDEKRETKKAEDIADAEYRDQKMQEEKDATDKHNQDLLDAEKKKEEEEKKLKEAAWQFGQSLLSLKSAALEYQLQEELKGAGDNEKEKERIKKKYAKKQRDLAIKQAWVNAGQAIIGTWAGYAEFSFLGTAIATLQTAAILAETLAQTKRMKAQEFAGGNVLDVIGANTGRKYKASLSNGKSGIYSKPTYLPGLGGIAGEKDPELVLSGAHTRNIQNNYPELLDAIALTIPEYAAGNVSSTTERTYEKTFTDPALLKSMDRITEVMDRIERNGLSVPWTRINEKDVQMKKLQESVRIK